MAIKKAPPTLTKPWVDVTSIKASLTRARELHQVNAKRISEMNLRVAKRREELEATLYDLTPSQRSQVVGRALGGLRADLKSSSLDARTTRLREIDAIRRSVEDAGTQGRTTIPASRC